MTESASSYRHVGEVLLASALAMATATAGCSLNRVGREEVATALHQHLRTRPITSERYARAPAVPQAAEPPRGDRPAAQVLEAPATLRELILHALDKNPDINAAEDIARAKAERIPQVTALPDPILSTKTLPEPVRTAEGDNYFILGVTQKLPVPEKLDTKGRVALEETRISLERLQQTRLRVIADVKRAYFQLYVLDKSIEITRANQDLLRGLIDVARSQVALLTRLKTAVAADELGLECADIASGSDGPRDTSLIGSLARAATATGGQRAPLIECRTSGHHGVCVGGTAIVRQWSESGVEGVGCRAPEVRRIGDVGTLIAYADEVVSPARDRREEIGTVRSSEVGSVFRDD